MKISIGIFMNSHERNVQLDELLNGLGLALRDFNDLRRFQNGFQIENDYLRICGYPLTEGLRGHKIHFAICSLKDFVKKEEIIQTIVHSALSPQYNLMTAFQALQIDHKCNLGLDRLKEETISKVHVDSSNKEFIYDSVKIAKAIHNAFKNN